MYYPEKNQNQLSEKLAHLGADDYAIICYCAAWCRTCNGFKPKFEDLATQFPQHLFVWVDVEEHEELLVDEDLEDFPTVLIQNKKGTVFYGPIPPFTEHIERVLKQTHSKAHYIPAIPNFEQLLITTT